MKTFAKPQYLLVLLLPVAALFYRQALGNFFFQDDFFNMLLANSQSLGDAFNIFKAPVLDFKFYRPLTTQLFWRLGQNLFGLQPLGYHLIAFGFFLVNILLVFWLVKLLCRNDGLAVLTSFFYAFSGSHFYRLFFLSQIQELALATFGLLTVIFYLRGSWLFLAGFLLALASKETAVVIPPVLFFADWLWQKKIKWPLLGASLMVVALYVIARLKFFGFASGEAYAFNFNPKQILNNYFWYGLWGLGLPEAYVNIKLFKLPLLINPAIFTEFGLWGNRVLGMFAGFFGLLSLGLARMWENSRDRWRRIREEPVNILIFGVVFFVVFLLPVAFYPFHKFAYSLTLPLCGLALILAVVVRNLSRQMIVLACFIYLLLSFSALNFNISNHWSVKRAVAAERVMRLLVLSGSSPVFYPNIYFRNNNNPVCALTGNKLHPSRELAYATGGTDMFRLYFGENFRGVYFEDTDHNRHLLGDSLMFDARQFLE